jgi:hypothetical protein
MEEAERHCVRVCAVPRRPGPGGPVKTVCRGHCLLVGRAGARLQRVELVAEPYPTMVFESNLPPVSVRFVAVNILNDRLSCVRATQ